MEPQGEELKTALKKFYQGRKRYYTNIFKAKKDQDKEKQKEGSRKKKKKQSDEEEEEIVSTKTKELFRYSDEGDLEIVDRKGELQNVIKLKYYRQPTPEEIEEVEQKRLTAIAEAQEVFEQARRELRALLESPEPSSGDILRLNRKITEADMAIQSVRFPEKALYTYESIDINKILLDETAETRKMFNVIAFIGRPLTLQDNYVREGRNVPLNVIEAAQQAENMRRTRKAARIQGVIFFKLPDTNEFGFLTMEWPVVITYNGTRYKSVKHALYGELAKHFKDMAMFGRIQATDDVEALAYNYMDSTGVTKEAWDIKRAELIQKITREKFKQNPELGEQLLNTGDVVLAADVIDDTLFGIGRSMEDPKAMKPRKWTGQNLLGKTLEKIRNELRKERQTVEGVAVNVATTVAPLTDIATVTSDAVDAVTDALPEGAGDVVANAADVVAATVSAITNFVTPGTVATVPTVPTVPTASIKRKLRIVRPAVEAVEAVEAVATAATV